MKKVAFCFFSLMVMASAGFAENMVLENQSSYPTKDQKSKMAVQWASSAREVQEENQSILSGEKLNPDTLKVLTESGKVTLNIPKNAEYFRVLVWSKGEGEPDLLTNWVDVVPNKTYKLETDHLVPAVLMAGSGC